MTPQVWSRVVFEFAIAMGWQLGQSKIAWGLGLICPLAFYCQNQKIVLQIISAGIIRRGLAIARRRNGGSAPFKPFGLQLGTRVKVGRDFFI
jgi:hypothetical protein